MSTIKWFQCTDIILPYLADSINASSICESKLSETLKYANTTIWVQRPVFKKDDEIVKANYRPISVLSSISKIVKKISYVQIEKFKDNKLSSLSCGFKKT